MLKKTTYFSVSLLFAITLNFSSTLFGQEKEAAPKISISFGDEGAGEPAQKAPAAEQAPAATANAHYLWVVPGAQKQRRLDRDQ
jgi:hypothetical protein